MTCRSRKRIEPVLPVMSTSLLIVLCGFLLLGEISGSLRDGNQRQLLQMLSKAEEPQKPTETTNTTAEFEAEKKRNCIFRIEEDDHLISVNKTREEIENEGKKIYDEICEGDLDLNGDKISSGVLASLCCG